MELSLTLLLSTIAPPQFGFYVSLEEYLMLCNKYMFLLFFFLLLLS